MGIRFWLRRFVTVLMGASVVIAVAQLAKGHAIGYALREGAFWGLVAATVFTAARLWQSRRGEHCALCNDIPSAQHALHSPPTDHGRSD